MAGVYGILNEGWEPKWETRCIKLIRDDFEFSHVNLSNLKSIWIIKDKIKEKNEIFKDLEFYYDDLLMISWQGIDLVPFIYDRLKTT